MLYFSKSTLGFYDSDIHGENIPQDAVEITRDQHQGLLKAHSTTGHPITADEKGHPQCVFVAPTPEQALAALKQQAKQALAASDIVVLRRYEEALPVPPEWVAYRFLLRECIAGTRTGLPTKPQ